MLAYRLNNYLKNVLRKPYKLVLRGPDALRLQGARALHIITGDANGLSAKTLYPPRRHSASTPDWVQGPGRTFDAKVTPLDEPASVAHLLPKTPHESIRRQFQMDVVYDRPGAFVATIPSARVWGEGIVIAPDDAILDDVSIDWSADSGQPAIVREWRVEKLISLDARIAVLSTAGAGIYYHWLFQLLPRIELIRRAGIPFESIDYFLINDLTGGYKHDSLKALGIIREKVLLSSEFRYVQARELVVPSIVLSGGCYPEWMRSFLRTTFLGEPNASASQSARRRLYLSRGKAKYRRVLNEDAALDLMKDYGFEAVRLEALSLTEQATLMSEAAVVVSPHGAGLSNVVFSPAGTKVIEIFAPELVTGFYWKLSTECQLDYYYILGKGKPETLRPDYNQSWDARQDITFDLDLLRAVLDQAQISRRPG